MVSVADVKFNDRMDEEVITVSSSGVDLVTSTKN